MSLQVWLPFNNNTINQGLFDTTVESTATYGTGKMTRYGASFDGSAKYIKIKDPISSSTTEFTISAWIYLNNVTTAQTLWNGRTTVGAAVSIFIINNTIRYDDSVQSTISANLTANTWYHFCATWKSGGKKKFYINGSEVLSTNAGTLSKSNTYGTIGRSSAADAISASNYMNGTVNDFRIYNNELSLKEVKELSKGLCVHYKLSRGGENLAQNTSNVSAVSLGKNTSGNLNQTRSDTDNRTIHVKVTTAATTGSNAGYYFSFPCPITNGKKYTGSYKIKFNKDMLVSLLGWENPTMRTSGTLLANTWYTFSKSATASADRTTCVITVYSNYANWTVDTEFWLTDLKVEEGDHATSWIPNKSDTLYSQLGYGSTEPDCSGYGNDGTIKGTPAYSNNTPRYEGSNYFGYDQNVQGNFGFNDFPITISFWAKVAAFDTSGWVVLAGQSTGYYLDADSSSGANWHSKATVQGYYRDGVLIASTNTTSQFISRDGNWHHYAYVCTLTDWTKMTVNGGSLWSSSWRAKVNISDFRIYATALSASDIKALYDTPISIDNKGNLYCGEVIE